MNYSEMNDFEIDKAVADAIGFDYEEAVMFVSPVDKLNGNHVEPYIRKKFTSNERHWKRFSPSRLWADAGPIIVRNLITLKPESLFVGGHRWFASSGGGDFGIKAADNNPLRAAMIVFLMMQESK